MYTRYIQIHTTYKYNTRGTGHSLLFLLLYSLLNMSLLEDEVLFRFHLRRKHRWIVCRHAGLRGTLYIGSQRRCVMRCVVSAFRRCFISS